MTPAVHTSGSPLRVAIFGASGHVGGTLVERLLARDCYDVRPIIHTPGNAWRLARRGIKLAQADLARRDQVRAAIAGCDIVVNCSFPSPEQMEPAVQCLVTESLAAGVKRFIHLSSVAVYGEHPLAEAELETAAPRAAKPLYGYYKLRQDEVVARAVRRGLPCVVLCPPNITGLNSRYLLEVLAAIERGTFALVDGGAAPCVLVDAANLAAAIELAFDKSSADGQRMFITDDEATTWRDVVDGLSPLADEGTAIGAITADDARRIVNTSHRGQTIRQAVGRMVALPEVKRILKGTPAIVRWARRGRRLSGWLPLGRGGKAPSRASRSGDGSAWSERLLAHQLRGVRHLCDRARSELGYAPEFSFAQSMENFRQWYAEYFGFGGDDWPLLAELRRAAR